LNSKNCTGFILWGVNDSSSWRFNGKALILDRKYKPKPAYYSLLNIFNEYNQKKAEEEVEVEEVFVNVDDEIETDECTTNSEEITILF